MLGRRMPRRPQDSREAAKIAARIGARVCALRKARGWTQADVSERIGLTTETYSRLERGLSAPSFPTLMRLCTVLDTTPDAVLLPGESERTGPGVDAATKALPIVREIQELDPDVQMSVEQLIHSLWKRDRRRA